MVSVVCPVSTSPFTFSDCFSDTSSPRPCPNSLIPFNVSCPSGHLLFVSLCPPDSTGSAAPQSAHLSHFWIQFLHVLLFLMLCCCYRLDLSEAFSSDAVDTSKIHGDCQEFILLFLPHHRALWIPESLNQQLSLCLLSFTKNNSPTVCWVMNEPCYPTTWGLCETWL